MKFSTTKLYGGWDSIFDFCFKVLVSKKGFDDHDNFQWNLENGQFIKKAFVLDSVESFLYVKNYRGGLYVIVIVFAKLMVGLVSSNEAECSFFGSDFGVQFFFASY